MRVPNGLRIDNPAWPLLAAHISYQDVTTADGNAGGTTLVCAGLATEPSYANHVLKILTGPAAGQSIEITTHPAGTDTATVRRAFTNAAGAAQQITAGTHFVILSQDSAIDDILNLLIAIAGGAHWNSYGPKQVEVDNDVTAGVTIWDPGGGVIPAADITPGTYNIDRIRAAVLTPIVVGAASTAADGLVFTTYAFPGASWSIGDIFVITFSGIEIDIGGVVTELPPVQLYGRVVREPDIESTVNTIDTNVGAMADAATLDDLTNIATTSAHAKLRRILLRMSGAGVFSATVQGAARTELDTMLEQIATYFVAAAGALSVTIDPGGVARTSLATLWNDLGQMLAGAAGITTWPASAPPGNGVSIAEAIRQIYDDLAAVNSGFQEQADTPVNITAILASETDVFNLSVAATRYIVRNLRIKSVDPGAETITVRLYELINDAQTVVDTFEITTANFATHHSLMDMFGLPHLAGDNLKVTVQASAAGPYAITGQYSYAIAA